MRRSLFLLRSSGLVAALLMIPGFTGRGRAAAPLYLAFGVETSQTSSLRNQILIQDLHEDHYHLYDINDGGEDSHVPEPLTLVSGGPQAVVGLGPMNLSPYPVFGNLIPQDSSADFRIELVSLAGPEETALSVSLMREGEPHPLSLGGQESLSLTSVMSLQFFLSPSAAAGTYRAKFRISDLNGVYLTDSMNVDALPPGSPRRVFDSNFTVLAHAVPEPFPASLAALALVLPALLRKRP